ncbi:universal stress protein [Aquimarina sp. 2201CG1-2-11]|uniref:universal stress protein n=1 Tax=Aquimarina discodermiae TaxID=3231043 RepID=UPI003462E728
MKRILLPTDFSDNAYNAIRYAMQFFKDEETIFYLLNTFTPASYHAEYLIENPTVYGLEDVALANSNKGLERIEIKLKKEFANQKHEFVRLSAFNTLIGEIKEVVDTYKIDLIVMGTKGATGAKEIFIGTHTMYTIKKVKCPVIAVPSGYQYQTPNDILFTTDYNFNPKNPFIPLLREVCGKHHSKLHVLNAYAGVLLHEKQEKTKMFLDKYLEKNTHVFHIAEDVDVLEAVEGFLAKHTINLLIMIHNKHSFFENLLFTPVINKITYHTNIPFLVIPSEKRIQS